MPFLLRAFLILSTFMDSFHEQSWALAVIIANRPQIGNIRAPHAFRLFRHPAAIRMKIRECQLTVIEEYHALCLIHGLIGHPRFCPAPP